MATETSGGAAEAAADRPAKRGPFFQGLLPLDRASIPT